VDPWLGGGIQGELAARVRLSDDGLDRWTLFNRHFGARGAARYGRPNDGFEQAGLAAEGAVNRLNNHVRGASDGAHGSACIAVLQEDAASSSEDLLTRLGRLRVPAA